MCLLALCCRIDVCGDMVRADINIIHGDCMEHMKNIDNESIDLIVTDPPYNIGQANKRTKVGNKIISNKEAWGEWDDFDNKEFDKFMFDILKEFKRIMKEGASLYCFTAREKNGFYNDYACNELGFTYQNTIAIIKENPLPHFTKTNWRSAFELAFYISKGKPKTFNFINQQKMVNIQKYVIGNKDSKHPTEKPLKVVDLLVQVSSNENDLVLDPFLGSGTTSIACHDLKRNFIGFELKKEYYDNAVLRLERHKSQGQLF